MATNQTATESCPCGTPTSFSACCGPYLNGSKPAPTAEQLMRSRYTAYVKGDIDYVKRTHDPETLESFDAEVAKQWSSQSEWIGLEIKRVQGGGPKDHEGMVEFVARYRIDGKDQSHHEVSLFHQHDGQWYFVDGQTKRAPTVRTEPKIGRNDPCSCGSNKKFKKCCGA